MYLGGFLRESSFDGEAGGEYWILGIWYWILGIGDFHHSGRFSPGCGELTEDT